MSEWKEVNSSDYCYKIADGTHDSPKRCSDGRFLITSKHIKGTNIDFDNAYFISEEDYQKIIKRSKVDQWDVLISMIGEYCGFCYLEDSNNTEYAVKNVGIMKIGDEYKAKWLYYYLNSPKGKDQLYQSRAGTSQPYIALSALRNLTIPVPNDLALSKIVEILSSLDDKIAVNRRICENLEAQAQALFKHWFVDFAPFKNGKFVESELGLIPEGWRVGKADDFYTINIGKTPPRAERQWFSESKGNNKIWISISDMGGCGAFISDSKEYLTPEAQSKFNVVMVPAGTILLSFKLTIGRVAIADNELTTNEAIARFILPNSNYREFTYLYLRQYNYGSLGSTSSIATAVNSKIIKSMPFLMPSAEVMTKFSSVVSKLFDEIRIFNNESRRLSTLRDTLLPKLMSGEIKI